MVKKTIKKKRKKIKFKYKSKAESLVYVVIFLWIVFGILGIHYNTNLPALAGYYASLSIFIGTYLWGEYKRSSVSTKVLESGPSSTREIIIYLTILLWILLGLYGIFKNANINDLTVYFASLSPFVSSYIIYKTNKGAELPIFNGDSKKIADSGIDKGIENNINPTKEETTSEETIKV